jgi:hypothetical protein
MSSVYLILGAFLSLIIVLSSANTIKAQTNYDYKMDQISCGELSQQVDYKIKSVIAECKLFCDACKQDPSNTYACDRCNSDQCMNKRT